MKARTTALILATASAFAACGEGAGGPPVKATLPEPSASSKPQAPPPGEVVRTVSQRNPFGNVAVRDNLLWDGDFEWRPSFPEQYGWLIGYGSGVGFGLPKLGTGARCRSGLKCAVLAPGDNILGIALGVEDRDLLVSFWASVDDGTCNGVRGVFISAYDEIVTAKPIEPVQAEPFGDGWCQFEQVNPARKSGAYLSIQNQSGSFMVIDDAVVRPLDPSEQRVMREGPALPPAEVARLETLRQAAKQLRLPRDPPPHPGKQKLAAHLRRLMR